MSNTTITLDLDNYRQYLGKKVKIVGFSTGEAKETVIFFQNQISVFEGVSRGKTLAYFHIKARDSFFNPYLDGLQIQVIEDKAGDGEQEEVTAAFKLDFVVRDLLEVEKSLDVHSLHARKCLLGAVNQIRKAQSAIETNLV